VSAVFDVTIRYTDTELAIMERAAQWHAEPITFHRYRPSIDRIAQGGRCNEQHIIEAITYCTDAFHYFRDGYKQWEKRPASNPTGRSYKEAATDVIVAQRVLVDTIRQMRSGSLGTVDIIRRPDNL
jgi:hypothetical protein